MMTVSYGLVGGEMTTEPADNDGDLIWAWQNAEDLCDNEQADVRYVVTRDGVEEVVTISWAERKAELDL